MKENWHKFMGSEPGRRFQERYEGTRGQSRSKRFLGLLAGLLLLAVGLFFLIAPGPGVLFLVPGAILLAQTWLPVARALDRAELWGRKILARVRKPGKR